MQASFSSRRTPVPPANAYVLVVEDQVDNYVTMMKLLAYAGVQNTAWKPSGWGVVQFADTLPHIDLILLDLRLPQENGYDVLQQIRATAQFKSTLVVAVTGSATKEELRRARQAGFDGFLGKPLDLERFPGQLRRILNGDPVWEYN